MKLILLKLTSFVFVNSPGVYAALPSLRGSDVMVAITVEASCEDGYKAGKRDVKRFWRSTGRNCDNVWQLEQQARRRKNRNYPRSGNWRTESYNRCARDAIDTEVKKIEKKCLEDDSSQCTDLGKAAAENVVLDNFCSPGRNQAAAAAHTNYKKECKKAAYKICEGQIPVVAKKWCSGKKLRTPKLRDMQGKCKSQVNRMVPRDDYDESFDEVGGRSGNSSVSKDLDKASDSSVSSVASKDLGTFNEAGARSGSSDAINDFTLN